jgi:hypothetical protein
MSKFYHDPTEYIRGLQQLLVSDKKRIAFLFGAGTSLAKKNSKSIKVPAIWEMTDKIEASLNVNKEYLTAFEEIREEIEEQKLNYNIETLLSNIEQKIKFIGKGKLNGLDVVKFQSLLDEIKIHIRDMVGIHKEILKDDNIDNLIHVDFAKWIDRSNRIHPIEIFTTNYDFLFEIGLEKVKIPYYDGFSGSYQPFFNSESVDDLNFIPNQTKLWKLHGSLGWHLDEKTKNVWRKDSDDHDILIYPSTLKYDESKKQPYTALMDRLTNFLKQSDTVLIACGYSFNDDHINERIMTALNTNTTAHVLALFYDIEWNGNSKKYLFTEDSKLAQLAKSNPKLSVFASRTAMIGGQFGEWKLKRETDKDDPINIDSYFDPDWHTAIEDEVGSNIEEKWTGEGELILSDYSKFVKFLQSMIIDDTLFRGDK